MLTFWFINDPYFQFILWFTEQQIKVKYDASKIKDQRWHIQNLNAITDVRFNQQFNGYEEFTRFFLHR